MRIFVHITLPEFLNLWHNFLVVKLLFLKTNILTIYHCIIFLKNCSSLFRSWQLMGLVTLLYLNESCLSIKRLLSI
jgi:hypothetical protein